MSEALIQEEPVDNRIVIPYKPRVHFEALHNSCARWIFLVAHRRAGKSVFAINHMIRAAIQNQRTEPPPRYAYVGPSFEQTKDLIWGYLKYYTSVIPGMRYLEGELKAIFPHNGATITLYGGAKAYERMRGMYFDGVMLDEFPLLNPSVFRRVVRPCLADYKGWCIVSGTSAGDDHFAELKRKADKDKKWEVIEIPITATDCLDPDEVLELTDDMDDEEYAQEMLCSFDTPVQGAYYAKWINAIVQENRLCRVPYQEHSLVYTAWDMGVDDDTAIWFIQRAGREYHAIHCHVNNDEDYKYYRDYCYGLGYSFGCHLLPHDAEAREQSTNISKKLILQELFNEEVHVVPIHRVEDGISMVRGILPTMWFDKEGTEDGFTALKNYHKSKMGKPVGNWASHPADALRTFAVGAPMFVGFGGSPNVVSMKNALRRKSRRAV